MSKYSNLDKDALVAEVKRRRTAGSTIKVDLRAPEDDLRAALDLDDETQPPATELSAPGTLGNQLPREPETPTQATQPSDEDFSKGVLYKSNQDGYVYAVITLPLGAEDPKPVKARIPAQPSGHPGLYWEGSQAEFEANFKKV